MFSSANSNACPAYTEASGSGSLGDPPCYSAFPHTHAQQSLRIGLLSRRVAMFPTSCCVIVLAPSAGFRARPLQRAASPPRPRNQVLVQALVFHCRPVQRRGSVLRSKRALFSFPSSQRPVTSKHEQQLWWHNNTGHTSLDSRSSPERTQAERGGRDNDRPETRRNNRGPAIAPLTASNVPRPAAAHSSGHCDNDHASGIPMLT